MKTQRILLPVDTRSCYLEVFHAANGFAGQPGATVTLLHVVNLNITAPEKRVYDQLGREARWHLQRLARHCLQPGTASIVHVRFGDPADEILAEAGAGDVDLIILPFRPAALWQRLLAPVAPRVTEKVVRRAACGVFLANAKSRFNCEQNWGRPAGETAVPLDHPGGTLENESSPVFMVEDSRASQREEHHVAA